MKSFILLSIVTLLLVTQCVECRHTHTVTKRSIRVFGVIANKTCQVTGYVMSKGRSIKDFTVDTVNSTFSSISSLMSRGKNRLLGVVGDQTTSVKNKFQFYIDKAQKTASTIYDNIAPEQVNYECKDGDPANYMTTPELITLHGYTAESHIVITEDGYLLTLHRIPFPRNMNASPRKTVFIHHGILASSADWVLAGPRKGLAYILSDAGYDVWMANARGNTYSRAHISRNVESYEFWNFTFHEVAQYDLPAAIDYIVSKKGGSEKINYIGFSMGTTTLFALLSINPEYNNILRAGFALAPIVYTTNIKSPFKILSKFGNNIEYFMKLFGANEFLPRNAVTRYLAKHSCKLIDYKEALCEMSMFLLCGQYEEHFDKSLTPLVLGHIPAGASTKTLAHYAQEIKNNGKFQQFDYGVAGNMKQYGTETPPEYEMAKVTLPMVLMSAKDDWLSSATDVKKLYETLPHSVEHYVIEDKRFNHVDFVFAKDARELVYDPLIKLLDKSYSEPIVTYENS